MKNLIKVVGTGTVLLLAVGCFNTEPPLGPTTLSAWEGTLTPSTRPDPSTPLITGNAAAVVRQAGTEVGIGLREFEDPDLDLDWGLYEGRCDDPGGLLGAPEDYPPLSADELEAASFIALQLEDGDAYHVSVTDADSEVELACGNLSETEL